MGKGKLSEKMMELLWDSTQHVVDPSGQSVTVQSLVKRGMLERVQATRYQKPGFAPTKLARQLLKVSDEYVALNYARENMRHGSQLRARGKTLVTRLSGWNKGEMELCYQWMETDYDEEINRVHEYHLRAIELARAEIRAGVAAAEIGLVG